MRMALTKMKLTEACGQGHDLLRALLTEVCPILDQWTDDDC